MTSYAALLLTNTGHCAPFQKKSTACGLPSTLKNACTIYALPAWNSRTSPSGTVFSADSTTSSHTSLISPSTPSKSMKLSDCCYPCFTSPLFSATSDGSCFSCCTGSRSTSSN